jgi:hypothetical protein
VERLYKASDMLLDLPDGHEKLRKFWLGYKVRLETV